MLGIFGRIAVLSAHEAKVILKVFSDPNYKDVKIYLRSLSLPHVHFQIPDIEKAFQFTDQEMAIFNAPAQF